MKRAHVSGRKYIAALLNAAQSVQMLQENQRNLSNEHRLAFSQLDTHFDEIQHLVTLDENAACFFQYR